MGLCLWEVPAVKSLSHGYAVPAPFNKGAFFRPVSFYGAIPGFFRLSIDSVGRKYPETHKLKRGKGLNPTPDQSEGGNPGWFLTGGFLRGEQFERGQALAESGLDYRLKG